MFSVALVAEKPEITLEKAVLQGIERHITALLRQKPEHYVPNFNKHNNFTFRFWINLELFFLFQGRLLEVATKEIL